MALDEKEMIMRLDTYLASNGLAKSRTRAAELISGGYVTVNGKVETKPSREVSETDDIVVTGEEHGFVGRGGMKLDGALTRFGIDVTGFVCGDIGASTGGFTDCLIKRGARHVYAVDAGHGQLDSSLIVDPRVTSLEGVNARYMTKDTLPEKCDMVVSDLSFISQTLVIPAITDILKPDGLFITLIKPQFECGRSALNKNGIVKDKNEHLCALRSVVSCAVSCGLMPKKIMPSPIKGGDGNREFLMLAEFGGTPCITDNDLREAVNE